MDDDDRCEWRGRSNAHVGADGREWRRWSALVATVWIQAVTGTNFDFSAYSSALKSSLGVSQQSLNYLATASDLGKAFGWSSGLALLYMPLPAVLLLSAALGLAADCTLMVCMRLLHLRFEVDISEDTHAAIQGTFKVSYYGNPVVDVLTNDGALLSRYPSYRQPNIWLADHLPELDIGFSAAVVGCFFAVESVLLPLICGFFAPFKLNTYVDP
ncbi:hypothetical protein ACQ4PT_030855 [Festuca glaucescens]